MLNLAIVVKEFIYEKVRVQREARQMMVRVYLDM
jgi:hypothetical protein